MFANYSATELLFHYLVQRSEDPLDMTTKILIPDTVIYKCSQPYFWYFTTAQGTILRESKKKISYKAVKDEFLAGKTENDIVASHYSYSASIDKQDVVTVEHFNAKDFNRFLLKPEKPMKSFLQKFIAPKNDKNSTIKVTWTPQFSILENKTNINKINDQKVNLYERIVTHEGPEHLAMQDSINSPTLANDILKTCNFIADHVKKVSKGGERKKVKRMTLYFKIDCMERLFLMYASELLMRDEQNPMMKNVPKFTIPKEFRNIGSGQATNTLGGGLGAKKNAEEQNEKKEHAYCSRCHILFVQSRLLNIPYKYMLDSIDPQQLTSKREKKFFQFTSTLNNTGMKSVLQNNSRPTTHTQTRIGGLAGRQPSNNLNSPLINLKTMTQSRGQQDFNQNQNYDIFPKIELYDKVTFPQVKNENLYKTLTKERFSLMKQDHTWTNSLIKVCENCYLDLTTNQFASPQQKKRLIMEHNNINEDKVGKQKVKDLFENIQSQQRDLMLKSPNNQANAGSHGSGGLFFGQSAALAQQNNLFTNQLTKRSPTAGAKLSLQSKNSLNMMKSKSTAELGGFVGIGGKSSVAGGAIQAPITNISKMLTSLRGTPSNNKL